MLGRESPDGPDASGSSRLDAVLGGGLPAGAVNLIVGLPGTGKTMMVQQYVFENATPRISRRST